MLIFFRKNDQGFDGKVTLWIRKKIQLTPIKMGKLLGVSQHRISEIERGIDGRSETITQQHLLTAIELLEEYGLIDKLFNKA